MNCHTLTGSQDLPVLLDAELKNSLTPWLDPTYLRRQVPMHVPTPTLEVMTDASLHGWCGLLLPHKVEGVWAQEVSSHSMNWKELKAIHLTISHFASSLRGRCVRVLSDNTTALACLRRQGSLHSIHLLDLSREVLELTLSLGITLVPLHIKGVLNVLADNGSGDAPISTEWSLDRRSFVWLCSLLGCPQVDLFATRTITNYQSLFLLVWTVWQ